MPARTLTVNVVDASSSPVEDATIKVRALREKEVLIDGANTVIDAILTATTNAAGVATVELFPSSDIDSRYHVGITSGDLVSEATFAMPDTDTSLAAALEYPLADQISIPVQGWRLSPDEPVDPGSGDGWFDPDDGTLRVRNGDEWVAVSGEIDASAYVRLDDYTVVVGDIESDAQALDERVTANETGIAGRVPGNVPGFHLRRIDPTETSLTPVFVALADLRPGSRVTQAANGQALVDALELLSPSPTFGTVVLLTVGTSGEAWVLLTRGTTSPTWRVMTHYQAEREPFNDDTTLTSRLDALEAAGGGSAAGGLRHVEVAAIQHTTTFGLGDRVSNAVGAVLYALDPPVEVGELVFVYQPDGDGDPDPNGWTIAVRVDDAATTAPFTQSTQFLQILTAPMVAELETNTSFVSRLDALEAGGVTISTTPPSSPSDGALWFNPANQHLATYDADTTSWLAIAAGGDHDRVDANEGNIAVNTANIQGEVNQRIAGDAALDERVLALEGIDTSEQLVSPVEYNAAEHTLTLNHVDGTSEVVTLGDPNQVETLLTTDDEVHITWYAGMGSEAEVYEQPARSEDGGETPELDVATDPVNGLVLRNTSDTFVAGLSWVGEGIAAGESVFLLGKFNVTEDQPYQHTILSNYELTIAMTAHASETRFTFTPTGESSSTLTLPVAVGTNGVGDFILGIQLSDPANSNVTATVAINGAANAVAATHIGSMPSLAWSTRTNFGCRWETPLQDTPSINTFHLLGDAWDVVVGRRDTAWTADQFRALTDPATSSISNRTSLYGDKFRVADAPIWSRGVHWSERATMPLDRDQPATVHHLRTYIPIARAVDLYFDVACTRQTTHDPQTYLHLPDTERLRRAFIDLGDETVGDGASTADVRIDRAKLDQWVIADRAVTITQQRDAPLWSLAAGWPSNYYVLSGAHHTWALVLIRANATADGCPEGHANYVAVSGYIGTTPNGATERWVRLGVRT